MIIISSIFSIFNNREIAIGIWLIFIIIFALTKRSLRKSIKSSIKALFEIKILVFIFVLLVYGFGTVILLYIAKYWNFYLLKDTIIWYCLPGFIMSVKYITSKDDKNLAKRIIIDNIELLIIFEFIVNIYVFPLLAEMFILPITAFIVLLDVVSRRDKKHAGVSKFLRTLQFFIGISIIGYSINQVVKDFNNFGNINILKEFLLPIILTITFIPFIYFMILYSSHESFFIWIPEDW